MDTPTIPGNENIFLKTVKDIVRQGIGGMNSEDRRFVEDSLEKCIPTKPTQVIENFDVRRLLGQGGFGRVYMGNHFGTDVAIKQINPQQWPLSQIQKELDFLIEVKECNRFVKVQMAFYDRNPFVVLELAADSLATSGKISCKDVVRFGVQLLQGLTFLQDRNMVHCDLKTSNILRTITNNVKIGDLGSTVRLTAGQSFFQATKAIGTYSMAHGESNKNLKYGFKTDVFGVGVSLFEAMTKAPLMQCHGQIDGKCGAEKQKFYVECFFEGRIVQKICEETGECITKYSEGKPLRETIQARIVRYLGNKSVDSTKNLLLYLLNPGKAVTGIPLASEVLQSKEMKMALESTNLQVDNIDLHKVILPIRTGIPVTEFRFFKLPSIENAVIISATFSYNSEIELLDQLQQPCNDQNLKDKQLQTDEISLPSKNSAKVDQNSKQDGTNMSNSSNEDVDKPKSKPARRVKRQLIDSSTAKDKVDKHLKCEICGAAYKYPSLLERHLTVHYSPKFECKTCGEKFKRLDYLSTHAIKHDETKYYSCTECKNYTTAFKQQLGIHKKSRNCKKAKRALSLQQEDLN